LSSLKYTPGVEIDIIAISIPIFFRNERDFSILHFGKGCPRDSVMPILASLLTYSAGVI
jgi:hypothetical protein